MPALRMPTLADLACGGLALRIWCIKCGRNAERDGLTLRLLLGPQQPIYGARKRRWCVECGARGRKGDVCSMPEQKPVRMGPGQ